MKKYNKFLNALPIIAALLAHSSCQTNKYLWILSRTPELPKDILDKLLANIKQRGYDLSRLVYVEQ